MSSGKAYDFGAPADPSYQVVVSFQVGSRNGKRIGADNIRRTLSNLLPAVYAPGWKVEDVAVAVRTIGAGGESSVDEGRWDAPANHPTNI